MLDWVVNGNCRDLATKDDLGWQRADGVPVGQKSQCQVVAIARIVGVDAGSRVGQYETIGVDGMVVRIGDSAKGPRFPHRKRTWL